MGERPTWRRRTSDAATEWAFATGWRIVRALPERSAYRTFDRAADMLWRRGGPGVQQLERNLGRVLPESSAEELSERARLSLRSYLRYWCDTFRLPTWSPERVSGTFILQRDEILDRAVSSDDGALMVVNHSGNWDHAGAWGCLRYGGLTTVAERLKPEGLYQRFLDYREAMGMEILPTGDPGLVRKLARRLRDGRLVPLMGDRDISRNGIAVDLLGEPASFPAGPALLSIITGAPVHPVTLWYEDDHATGYVHDAVPVPSGLPREDQIRMVTQGIADAFGEGIRRHPLDWHMMQPVWLADLDPARLARRTGADSEPGAVA